MAYFLGHQHKYEDGKTTCLDCGEVFNLYDKGEHFMGHCSSCGEKRFGTFSSEELANMNDADAHSARLREDYRKRMEEEESG